MRRLVGFLVVLAIGGGLRAYNNHEAKTEARKKLVSLCESDSKCVTNVDQNFDACWKAADKGKKVDGAGLVQCLIRRSRVLQLGSEQEVAP